MLLLPAWKKQTDDCSQVNVGEGEGLIGDFRIWVTASFEVSGSVQQTAFIKMCLYCVGWLVAMVILTDVIKAQIQ